MADGVRGERDAGGSAGVRPQGIGGCAEQGFVQTARREVEHHAAGRDPHASGDLDQRESQAVGLSGSQFCLGEVLAPQVMQQHVRER